MRYPNIIKRMGFQRDQEGIMNRYLRERSHWESHLEKTRNFIRTSLPDNNIASVAVLGSGWLLDIPLEELVQRFEKIYLVDIFHPPQIRNKVRNIKKVDLLEADLSGGAIEQLWQITRSKGAITDEHLADEIILVPPLVHLNVDAFISANLLNQLDIIACDFLFKKGYFQQQSPDHLRSRIQAFHIEWITRTAGCIITDTMEINLPDTGEESVKSLLHTELPDGFRSEEWIWEFDTHGTYNTGTLTSMQVQAVEWD